MLSNKKSIVKALINKFPALSARIDVAKCIPLSKGEDAVVLAQASYKCGVRVHPVGLHSVSEANKTIFHFPLSIFHSREVNHAKH